MTALHMAFANGGGWLVVGLAAMALIWSALTPHERPRYRPPERRQR